MSLKDWIPTTYDASCSKPFTLADFERCVESMKKNAYEPRRLPRRIVSAAVYAEAQKAVDADATPVQVERCLCGEKWDNVRADK